MALAAYKDLCIDACDAEAAARFWGELLNLAPGPHRSGVWRLDDLSGDPLVWINPVPEPTTVKNRIHLDVNAEGLDAAVAAGAVVVDGDSFPWTVLRDPDGQELCIFVRAEPIGQPLHELVWDSGPDLTACQLLARWWGEVLRGRVEQDDEGYPWVADIPGAPFASIDVVPVPEPRSVKNRVHIDVTTDDLDRLVAHGARVLREKGDAGIGWTVLADPDGNEFCAFTPD